ARRPFPSTAFSERPRKLAMGRCGSMQRRRAGRGRHPFSPLPPTAPQSRLHISKVKQKHPKRPVFVDKMSQVTLSHIYIFPRPGTPFPKGDNQFTILFTKSGQVAIVSPVAIFSAHILR